MHDRVPLRPPSPASAFPGAAREADAALDETGLERLLRLLRRRKATILASLVLGLLLAGLAVHALPDRYRAVAVLLFEPGGPGARPGDPAAETAGAELGRLASEIEVMRSRGLLEAVVRRAELLFEAEFNPTLEPPRGVLVRLGLAAPPAPADLRLSRQRARTVARLRERLTTHVLGRSRAVEIAVESRDPDLAARVANAVAATYLARSAEATRGAAAANTAWLDEKVAELRRRVQAADRAVAEYRLSSGLVERRDAGIREQTIAEINRALLAAGQARGAAAARLRQAEELVARVGAVAAADRLGAALVQALRAEEATLLRRRAELAVTYGPRHPRMAAVDAELLDLRGEIAGAVARAVQALRDELAVARERERELRGELAAATRATGEVRRAEVQLAQLEREAAAERALFETFLARLKATAIAAEPPLPAARVITEAEPPLAPVSPNRTLLLALAAMAMGAGGLGLAFAAEALDRGVRDLRRLEAATGRPGLALLPALRRGVRPADAVLRRPHSAFAEAVRGLHTAVALANPERRVRSVMLTSADSGEGKTSLACALARLAALGGQRVLLIDADLRHPGVAAALGLPAGPGLGELLAGRTDPRALARPDPGLDPPGGSAGGLDVLTAGGGGDPAAVLTCARLDELLDELGRGYDLTIVDAPPVLAVAEPRALAPAVDATVIVVRWAHTPARSVARAARLLRDAGAALAGGALTRVDLRRHARDGGGEGGGHAAGYYAE